MTDARPILTPRLICSDAARAIDFYVEVFGARVVERFAMPDGNIVHAALSIRGAIFSLAQAVESFQYTTPAQLGGSAVLITLDCDDPDALANKAVEHGGEIVIPIEDRFYGHREGRIRDPFGHLWILSKVVRELSAEEIQRAMAEQ